jgi:pyruvate dehydrogenase E1 component alpha subunit
MEHDQVRLIGEKLDPAVRRAVEAEVEREIAGAIDFAERSPFPEGKELFTHVYA